MKVLLATDGGAPAEAAKRLIERTADRARVEITVLNVVPEPPLPSLQFEHVPSKGFAAETAASLRQVGFKVKSKVLQGRPGPEIVRLAEEGDFELTVVGAGTKTWLGSMLLGSMCFMLPNHRC